MANKFQLPFTLDGHVINLKRSLDSIVMHLETHGSGVKELQMPIKIKNDFELIPYQVGLLNHEVKYHTDIETSERKCKSTPYKTTTYFTLKVLTGPLMGKTYTIPPRWENSPRYRVSHALVYPSSASLRRNAEREIFCPTSII